MSQTATSDEIKAAFRKLAMVHHPDKGGDVKKFQAISSAYELLSNAERRKRYDTTGEEDLPTPTSHNGPSAEDFMRQFFPFMSSQPRNTIDVYLTLEELWLGCTKTIRQEVSLLCSGCNGNGIGMTPIDRKCPLCRGAGRKHAFVDVPLVIPKGHSYNVGFKIPVNDSPGAPKLNARLCLEKHTSFKRVKDSHDLLLDYPLTLVEALCGFTIRVQTPDGRTLKRRSITDHVYSPGEIARIDNEGLAYHDSESRTEKRGSILVRFNDIRFPQNGKELTENRAVLGKLFGVQEEEEEEKQDSETIEFLSQRVAAAEPPPSETTQESDQEQAGCVQQ